MILPINLQTIISYVLLKSNPIFHDCHFLRAFSITSHLIMAKFFIFSQLITIQITQTAERLSLA